VVEEHRCIMAKMTKAQIARARAMSERRGSAYPNAWSNLKVVKADAKKSKKKPAKRKA
jgi:hypothetical protein